MRNFKSSAIFVVTTNSGRKLAECINIEYAEPIANAGRDRDIWKRNKDGKGYCHHKTYKGIS